MNGGPALAWARAEWRRRPLAFLFLTLAVATAAGLVLAVAAGARRTATAYDRLVEASNRYDVSVQDDNDVSGGGESTLLDDLRTFPNVQGADRLGLVFAAVESEGEEPGQLLIAVGERGIFGRELDRPVVLEGRVPSPTEPHELIVNEQAASDFGVGVGDELPFATFSAEQLVQVLQTGDSGGPPAGPMIEAEVVGIGRIPDDLDRPDAAAYATPAFYERYAEEAGGFYNMVRVALEDDSPPSVVAFRRAVEAHPDHDPGNVYFDYGREDGERVVDGVRVQALGLVAFAVAAAVAAAFALGQAMARQFDATGEERRVLGAMGVHGRQRLAVDTAPYLPVVVIGTLLGAVAAVAASGFFPVGVGRRAEPSPGIRVEPVIVGVGAMLLVAVGVAGLLALSRLRRAPATSVGLRSPSPFVRAAVAMGASPAMVSGVRLALEADRGSRRSPVRSTIAGTVAGLAAVVASGVFVGSLDHVKDTPTTYGWAWDVEIDGGEFRDETRAMAQDLVGDPDVAGVAMHEDHELTFDDVEITGHAFLPLAGGVRPVVLEGRLPEGPDEAAIGPASADRLGVSIGDSIEGEGLDGPVPLRIVGLALPDTDEDQSGSGVVLTPDGMALFDREGGASDILVDVAPGADVGAVLERFEEGRETLQPVPPISIRNIDLARNSPLALAAFLGLVALAAAGHGVATSVWRRRRDLAVLRALGFRRRQVTSVVAWQATCLALVTLAVALPIGVVLGRQIWTLVARSARVVVEPIAPALGLLLLAAIAVLAVNVVAFVPGLRVRRMRPAEALRSE